MFPLFLKRTADVLAPRLSVMFRRLLRLGCLTCLLETGQCHPNSKRSIILLCCQLQTNFHNTSIVQGVWASGGSSFQMIYGTLVCFQPHSLLIGMVWVPVMHFCVCHIHCRVHWRAGRRPGLCRLTSVLLLIRSTIREFSISSALWVFEVLCCLYWRSSYLIDHSMFWWMWQ